MALNFYYKDDDDVLSVRELDVTLYKDADLNIALPDEYELDFRLDTAVVIWKHGDSRRNKITLHKTFKPKADNELPGLAPWDFHVYSVTVRGEKRYFQSYYCLPDLKAYTTILNRYKVSFIWTNPYHVLKKLKKEAEEKEQIRIKKRNEEAPLREARRKAEATEKTKNKIFYYLFIICSFVFMIYMAKLGSPWKGAMFSMGSIIMSRYFDEDSDDDKTALIITFMIFANGFRIIYYYLTLNELG